MGYTWIIQIYIYIPMISPYAFRVERIWTVQKMNHCNGNISDNSTAYLLLDDYVLYIPIIFPYGSLDLSPTQ